MSRVVALGRIGPWIFAKHALCWGRPTLLEVGDCKGAVSSGHLADWRIHDQQCVRVRSLALRSKRIRGGASNTFRAHWPAELLDVGSCVVW